MEMPFIDKLALVYVREGRLLMTRSHNNKVWYIPGGKREVGEDDLTALGREINEELSTEIVPDSTSFYGTFEGQAHGKPLGVIVRMTCYMAELASEPQPANEIAEIGFLSPSQQHLVGPLTKIIFADLQQRGLI